MNTAPRIRLAQASALPKAWVRNYNNRRPKQPSTGFQGPEGHGEKLWIWSHRRSEQTIYTFRERLDGFHDLKQLKSHYKKTKPAKLRKDYWSQMAVVEFPPGHGSVGRSVFQKLRELKHLHEVAWDEDFRYKSPDEYTDKDKELVQKGKESGNEYRPLRTKKERGFALNRQKANSIADLAAILAGQGKGNRMVKEGEEGALVDVTVSWADNQDKNYAESWSGNVTHGIFDKFEKPTVVEVDGAEDATVLAIDGEKQPQAQ